MATAADDATGSDLGVPCLTDEEFHATQIQSEISLCVF